MAGLVPAIHALATNKKGVDARDKRGHDAERLPNCYGANRSSTPSHLSMPTSFL
jgi:hypothetical protein